MEYKNTKLIVFLNAFSNNEITEFEKFLASPFFKTSRDLMPLFNVLKRFHPDYSSEKFNEEKVFNDLYPDSKYSDKKSKDLMRTVSSSLLKAAEEFLYFSDIKNNKILKNRTLLKKLMQKNLTKYYDQYLNASYVDLKADEIKFGQDYLERFYLERLNTRYFSVALDFKSSIEHSFDASKLISSYAVLDLIRTAKIKLLDEKRRNIKHENDITDRLLKTVNMEEFLNLYKGTPQYIFLYFNYYTYKCLVTGLNNEFYQKAKSIFFENRKALSRYDKNFFYADLLNIVSINNINNEGESRKESFSLCDLCLEDKAYKMSENDFMQPDFYRNVIINADFLKEYEWAEKFINEYTDELNPEFRDNMKNYSKAIIDYGKGEFENSLENITKVKYDLVNFKVDVKVLMLKIFYELNLYEQAFSLTDTFKHFIKNSKHIRPEMKELYSNFLKHYTIILKLNNDSNTNETGLVRINMEKEIQLFQRTWLFEKLKELNLKE